MRMKLLGLMAALLLVAGCETPAEEDTTTEPSGTEISDAPPPPPPPTPGAMDPQEYLVVNVGDRIFFDFDKSDLRPDAIDQLNRQADFLKANGASRSCSRVIATSVAPASTTSHWVIVAPAPRNSICRAWVSTAAAWKPSATARSARPSSVRTRMHGARIAVRLWLSKPAHCPDLTAAFNERLRLLAGAACCVWGRATPYSCQIVDLDSL